MKKILFLILVLFAFCFTINHKVNAEENFDEDNINSISSSGIIPATTFEFMIFEELMNFYNAPITNEVNIEYSYYFSNFIYINFFKLCCKCVYVETYWFSGLGCSGYYNYTI